MLAVILVLHYIGCYWYGLGAMMHYQENWIKQNRLNKASKWELYLSSLHWSLGQSGLASTKIYPTNAWERLYASIISLLALIMLPCVIGLVVIWLMQLREAHKIYEEQGALIRRYLKQNQISNDLACSIVRFFRRKARDCKRYLNEDAVDFFHNLPATLHTRLHVEVYLPFLSQHPAFENFCNLSPVGATSITHTAMNSFHCDAGQIIFGDGDEAQMMFFVASGTLQYNESTLQEPQELIPGNWIGEACLWQPWKHRGYLKAVTMSAVITLQADTFNFIMEHGETRGWPIAGFRRYAIEAAAHYNQKDTPEFRDPTEAQLLAQRCFEVLGKSRSDMTDSSSLNSWRWKPKNTRISNIIARNVSRSKHKPIASAVNLAYF